MTGCEEPDPRVESLMGQLESTPSTIVVVEVSADADETTQTAS
jgi:hypothetical protein